ncbi:hypothetical protein B9086_010550 [Morganella morganii subsp. morganii]|uniref:Uncharacterized protein n=2 Tax=Enterobacterales TaxID=91347 RepID=A0A5U8SX99_SALET|nr:hypothetical protein AL531_00600 [Morganella morganii]EBQ6151219.1 hypothetical protein [Salmonella enterica subsp. enterica serovar Enteritidis]EBR9859028.1 hypothetical protein [Salmonella enterica subsp. enterica serovar Chester]ETO42856.1 hypothetical protein X965_18410 [Morganella sp. EGD-HP17]OFV02760.1 hypothetical protein HMPREF3119_03315 [Morganella sp. HMSC11D09]QCY22316.1 hypothetical protein EO986_15265 [Morganella morganii subsp. morganii]
MIFQSQNSNKKEVRTSFLLPAKPIIKLTVIYVMLLLFIFSVNTKKGKQTGRFLMLFLFFSVPAEDKKRTRN